MIFKHTENIIFNKKGALYILLFIAFINPAKLIADDYFWIGGSGNWSDINHWATISGGSVLHIQAPTVADDVFFDANSFPIVNSEVNINQKNAICHDMTWINVSNQPFLSGNDTTSLRIYGSLTLAPDMTFGYEGDLYFEATTTGQIIESANNEFICDINLQGNGGAWELTDGFQSSRNLSLIRGSFITNGNNFTATSFQSTSNEQRELILGNSFIKVNTWSLNAENLILEASQTNFEVLTSLENNNGNRLIYNNAIFTGLSSSLTGQNSYAVFNVLSFQNGNVSGDFTIDTLTFSGDGQVSGNDSINYLKYVGFGNLAGGEHNVKLLKAKDFCNIEGNNQIDSLWVTGAAIINGMNTIKYAKLKNTALITEQNTFNELYISREAYIAGNNQADLAFLNGNSWITGNNTFDDLNFREGCTYTLGINSVLTVNNQLNAIGTCYEPIRILSDTNGVQSTIVKNNGPFVGEYLSLRDIKAEGSTPFIANTSVDLGNNTNWTIQTTNGIDLFWVKGQGNWSDPSHWDESSGGPGGHCPPTEIDNAIFDGNSFSASGQQVNINIYNAVCRDMNWEEATSPAPTLIGPDTCNIRIFGSLYFNPTMNNAFLGDVFFEAVESGKIIRSANNSFNYNIWFNGRNGFWDLEDELTVLNDLFFQQGGVKTRGNDIRCRTFSSTDTTTRHLNLGISTVTMLGLMTDVWIMNGMNLTLLADSSLLISRRSEADIVSINAPVQHPLIYHNVEFYGDKSRLRNQGAYCKYNLVTFSGNVNETRGDCTIDTITYHGILGQIYNSDTIKTAIFNAPGGWVDGEHIIEIAYFYDDATVTGKCVIDTALFYSRAAILDSNYIDTAIVYHTARIEGHNTFRTATLLGDGDFYGENTFDDLTLSKAQNYYLEHSLTQTINNNLNLNGRCTGPIIIQSTENTFEANIHKVNGPVEGNYLSLRDIHASGSNLPFKALNSVDLGNNEGWDITTADPLELYWVNGSGYWSDSLHWDGVSGGPGGYCVPTPIDNVYFDENSFTQQGDSVKIDFTNATCHNMNWTGAKTQSMLFGHDTTNLRIYGSLKLNPTMVNNFKGNWYFETTEADHTLETFGKPFFNTMTFQGIGGEWKLLDNPDTIFGIVFKHGILDLSNRKIVCGFFNSNFINSRTLDISNDSINTIKDNTNSWHLNTANLTFNGENSVITSAANNGVVRTEGGGIIHYNNVNFKRSSRIYSIATEAKYNNIIFESNGSVIGNCTIDTLIIKGSGNINDSDTINYAHILGMNGNLVGGSHQVNTIIFDNAGSISGSNVIDSTIIHGAGNIEGMNQINKTLIIGGKAVISGQNNLESTILMGNGLISGANHFTSLKLTPNNLYELEENTTQFISENLFVRGNNCFPITLRSQLQGSQALISMPDNRVVSGDFVEIRDINAGGGATYFAGNFSSDLSNNIGWIFDNAPGYIYGFANDTTICEADVTIIGTQNFNPDNNTTFLWHDGSSGSDYLVKPDDTIAYVTVNYANDCAFQDTISIHRFPSPDVELGGDRTVCEHDTILPLQFTAGVDFLWHDGTTKPYIIISNTGIYTLEVSNEFGCTRQDDIYVEVTPAPIVFLGNDTIIRPGDQILLDAGNPGASYFWSSGDTSQTIMGQSKQTYWVGVNNLGCMAFDTIFIDEFPPCVIAVPTAFSPNGDGINDILYVRGNNFKEFELMVFNRWGELVFSTKDSGIGWDGTYQGEAQAMDSYNYYLKGICIDGQITSSKGTITLLR